MQNRRKAKQASATVVQKNILLDPTISLLAANDEETKQQRNEMLQNLEVIDALFNTVLTPKKESAEQEAAFTEQLKAIFAKYQRNLNIHDREHKDTCLMRAVRLGQLIGVQRMLRMGADANYKTSSNVTALYMLSGHNHANLDILDELMQNGADPNVACIDDQYPIINFALNSSLTILPVLKKFLKYPRVDINIRISTGPNAAYAAASVGNVKVLQLLIDGGADTSITCQRQETALLAAVEHQHWSCVEILLNSNANPNVGMILNNARPNEKLTPLMMVLERFKRARLSAEKVVLLNMFRLLIRSGADPFLICRDGGSVFNFLFDPDFKKHLDIVLEADLDFNKPCDGNGHTLLMLACQSENEYVIDALLKKKVNACLTSKNGSTALHFTADKKVSLMKKLFPACLPVLDSTMDTGHGGCTALRAACEIGNDKVVRLLLEKGANPRLPLEPLERQMTLLHIAAQFRFIEVVKLLIPHLNVNAQRDDGTTALFFAAQEGYLDVVTALCEAGADYTIDRNDGQSVIAIAHKFNHTRVVNYLMTQLSKEYSARASSLQAGVRIEYRIVKKEDYTPQDRATIQEFETNNTGLYALLAELVLISDKPATQKASQDIEPSSVSGRVFLKNKYSPEEFEELMRKKPSPDDSAESSDSSKSEESNTGACSSTISWMDGAITLTDVKLIEGQLKSRNCYLYLDEQALLKQGCANFDAFNNMLVKHAPQSGAAGLVKISGDHKIEVTCGDVTTTEKLSYELKLTNSPDRILCFRRRADSNNPQSLIVACVSVEGGLHNTNAIKSLPTKVMLNLPSQGSSVIPTDRIIPLK